MRTLIVTSPVWGAAILPVVSSTLTTSTSVTACVPIVTPSVLFGSPRRNYNTIIKTQVYSKEEKSKPLCGGFQGAPPGRNEEGGPLKSFLPPQLGGGRFQPGPWGGKRPKRPPLGPKPPGRLAPGRKFLGCPYYVIKKIVKLFFFLCHYTHVCCRSAIVCSSPFCSLLRCMF